MRMSGWLEFPGHPGAEALLSAPGGCGGERGLPERAGAEGQRGRAAEAPSHPHCSEVCVLMLGAFDVALGLGGSGNLRIHK